MQQQYLEGRFGSSDDPEGAEDREESMDDVEVSCSKLGASEEEEDDPVASQAGPLLGEEGYHDHEHSLVSSSKLGAAATGVFSSRVERLLRERQLRRVLGHDAEAAASLADLGVAVNEGVKDQEGKVRQRLLVVANRLPVSAIRRGENAWALELSAGGLVSALLGVKQFETKWIGWAGVNVQDNKGKDSLQRALENKGFVPVFLDEQTVDQYYNGYCNNVLWPLFHYIELTQEDRLSATRGLQSQFNAYKRANATFAQVVLSHYQKGDIVWCHDYHLMFLPKFLKEANSSMKVGWFLHTPFPSSEIYRTLPQRSELLQAVLKADLIGFHTYDYARHFVSACTRILGLEGTPDGVEDQGKLTRVAAFPIGIDAERFVRALHTEVVQNHIQKLSKQFSGRKVMLGVDRLDMIKGIPQKLLSFEKFLEDNSAWHDKVVMVQIAVPTRADVHEYQRLSSQVHEIVGRINGRFGTLTTVPIHHLDRSLEFYELCALYAITDVLLVTSLRDGMNLVSYEYVACQDMKKGVLVLSEFAGAAQSLGAGAILINPWNIVEAAAAIGDALNMPESERKERHRHNFMHVTSHTAQLWADTFVSELNDTVVEAELRTLRVPPPLPVEKADSNYAAAKNCLLILGFNAALTAQADVPRLDRIKEMELRLHPGLHETLRALCADPKTTVVILSGSERFLLDEAFGEFNLWLAAENGMFLRHTSGDWMTTMPEHLNLDWVESVQLVFDYFCERTPRSYVEARETSLVWNFKYADPEFGRVQAWDMLQHLWTGPISNAAVDVVQGSKSVEVRPVGVSKGAAIDRILGEVVHSKHMTVPIDYVLCIGHFLSKDEDIYSFFEPDLPYEKEMPSKHSDSRSPPRQRGISSRSKLSPDHHHHHYHLHHHLHHHQQQQQQQHGMPASVGGAVEGASVLDLNGDNYFSCTVGRQRSLARYSLTSSEEVVAFLKTLSRV